MAIEVVLLDNIEKLGKVGDTVRVYILHNFGSAKNTATGGRCTFSGYKLIGV